MGLVGGYGGYSDSPWYGDGRIDHYNNYRLGIRGRYFFGKGKLTPFVGINVCGQRSNEQKWEWQYQDDYYRWDEQDYLGIHLGVDTGIKYFLTDHFALGLILPVYFEFGRSVLEVGLGVSVSYLF